MSKLKFAILGCGRISYKHIEAMINNEADCVPVALCDLKEERAEDRKKQYLESFPNTIINVYTDYKKMLEEEDIDVVVIATESGYHGKHAIDVLNSGAHVMIEKPMALNLDEIDEINKLADEKNLKVCVSHQNRFNRPIQKLKRALEEGRFGKLINGTARILWTRDQHYYELAPWRGTKALDGGTLMNQCIHNIDLLQWMMNSKVVSVKSELGTFLRDIEMEDFGAILLRFENGAVGLIEGSACVYPKNLEETLSIFGETGTAVIGGLAVNEIKTWDFADKKYYDNPETKDDIDNVYGNGHTPLYHDFIEAINNDGKPLIDGYEGKKAVEIILRAYEESGF
ncbi:Gfo/Idh/MocA family protein [Microaceticoccus formicicus]|uniref:Gfo/Idh/MocA family protein n=1 Tax=Microaceticoccus formicicus TaxID=3118105 RepID=UPI003CD03883|nr:Gfo/Idh/MocA family oxidoreductase [Peptoniphilaceae bacterium AMB_02]